jgi:hypothetical protein
MALYEEALERRRRVLGPDHPDTQELALRVLRLREQMTQATTVPASR